MIDYREFFYKQMTDDDLRRIANDETQLSSFRKDCIAELADRRQIFPK